ncbi:MAG: hypothetical protein R6V57_17380, partial [Vicinamibacterales bacterium]
MPLEQLTEGYQAHPELPSIEPRVLEGIVRRSPDGHVPTLNTPITPLLDTTVLTNSRQDLNMWAHLKSEANSAAGVDAIVAFIRIAGINPLIPAFESQIEAGHRLR